MTATAIIRSPRHRRSRWQRWLRRTAIAAVVLLVADKLFGLATNPPRIGQWRSEAGRNAFVDAYQRTWARLPAPTRTLDIPTTFGTVRAYEWVSPATAGKTPVVLVPGRSAGSPMWVQNLPDLVPNHPVYAFDAIGDSGLSVQSAPVRGPADQASWIAQTIRDLGLGRAHLVGHSFGGSTAAATAVHRPDVVASLTLLEPVFALDYPPAKLVLSSIPLSISGLPQSWKNTALAAIGGVDPGEFNPNDPMTQMIDLGAKHYSTTLPMPSPLTDEQLQGLPMPVYVALGGRQSLAGAKAPTRTAKIPRHTLKVWPDTTHSLPMQVHAPLAADLDAFWAAVPTS